MTRVSSPKCGHKVDPMKYLWTLAKLFFEIVHFFVPSLFTTLQLKIPQLIQLINSLPHYVDQNAF